MKNSDAKILLEAIQSGKFRRTPFEVSFIPSITRQVASGKDLKPKQAEVLQAIYRKSQGG